MKSLPHLIIGITMALSLFISNQSDAQITINKDELPSKIGTTWTTINDTTEASVIVDVGQPGANQHWTFTEDIEGIEIVQTIVPLDSTPFKADFPSANFVMRYDGGLLDMIYSDVFPQIEGDVYFYQEISDTAVDLLGTGFSSSFVSGAAQFDPPNVIVNFIPMQYQDQWTTRSKFTISKDTTILGISGEFKLSVDDSAWSEVDAWGTITLPFGDFECLRMKSYVTMNEQVSLNDIPLNGKIARVVNYNWIAKDYGLIMRVASHSLEDRHTFEDYELTRARLYSRMTSFTSTPTSVERINYARPADFSLMQNFPNPFNPNTTISFHLLKSDVITLSIFNTIGQEVKTLVSNEHLNHGTHTYNWDGTDNAGNILPSGTYLYKLNTTTSRLTRKMNLVH